MVQVKAISQDGLKHEFSVTVPKAQIDQEVSSRLESYGRTAKLPGFRPGKVPMPILKQNFGKSAHAEVVDAQIGQATQKALDEKKLRPAMQPNIELVSFGEDKDLEFKLNVEVLPEISLPDFSKVAIEKFTAEVPDDKVTEAIMRIAKQMREPEIVAESRPAKIGDVTVIDFDGTVDGVAQPGMKGENHNLELGSNSFIPGFEDGVVGMKKGDKKKIKVTFPKDYHANNLAGKDAEFAVEVKELRTHKAVEMNDDLAKELGLPSLEKLRERLLEDIQNNYAQMSRNVQKRQLLDALDGMVKFAVPPSLLEREYNNIWQEFERSKSEDGLSPEDAKKSEGELQKEYRAIAERRIKLGLLLAEVGHKNGINVAGKELQNALIAEARRYPGQEKAVMDYYTKTEGALERLRAPILEEKIIDYAFSQAKVTEKKIAIADLMLKAEEE